MTEEARTEPGLVRLVRRLKGEALAGEKSGGGALAAGGVSALLASVCCLGPLVLVLLGVGGAWVSNLTVLAPFQPWFQGAALVALFFAYRRIFRPAAACETGEVCAAPTTCRAYRIIFWLVAALVVLGFAFPYMAPLFY